MPFNGSAKREGETSLFPPSHIHKHTHTFTHSHTTRRACMGQRDRDRKKPVSANQESLLLACRTHCTQAHARASVCEKNHLCLEEEEEEDETPFLARACIIASNRGSSFCSRRSRRRRTCLSLSLSLGSNPLEKPPIAHNFPRGASCLVVVVVVVVAAATSAAMPNNLGHPQTLCLLSLCFLLPRQRMKNHPHTHTHPSCMFWQQHTHTHTPTKRSDDAWSTSPSVLTGQRSCFNLRLPQTLSLSLNRSVSLLLPRQRMKNHPHPPQPNRRGLLSCLGSNTHDTIPSFCLTRPQDTHQPKTCRGVCVHDCCVCVCVFVCVCVCVCVLW